jgi:hypothetical protein
VNKKRPLDLDREELKTLSKVKLIKLVLDQWEMFQVQL